MLRNIDKVTINYGIKVRIANIIEVVGGLEKLQDKAQRNSTYKTALFELARHARFPFLKKSCLSDASRDLIYRSGVNLISRNGAIDKDVAGIICSATKFTHGSENITLQSPSKELSYTPISTTDTNSSFSSSCTTLSTSSGESFRDRVSASRSANTVLYRG